jgi:hypothetical protein
LEERVGMNEMKKGERREKQGAQWEGEVKMMERGAEWRMRRRGWGMWGGMDGEGIDEVWWRRSGRRGEGGRRAEGKGEGKERWRVGWTEEGREGERGGVGWMEGRMIIKFVSHHPICR